MNLSGGEGYLQSTAEVVNDAAPWKSVRTEGNCLHLARSEHAVQLGQMMMKIGMNGIFLIGDFKATATQFDIFLETTLQPTLPRALQQFAELLRSSAGNAQKHSDEKISVCCFRRANPIRVSIA
jgi:hypothetical protein